MPFIDHRKHTGKGKNNKEFKLEFVEMLHFCDFILYLI